MLKKIVLFIAKTLFKVHMNETQPITDSPVVFSHFRFQTEDTDNVTDLYRNTAWYICEGIHLSCVVLALYLLYALLHYRAIKTARQKDTGKILLIHFKKDLGAGKFDKDLFLRKIRELTSKLKLYKSNRNHQTPEIKAHRI